MVFKDGIHFIRYLEDKHYFGIDKDTDILNGAKIELDESKLIERKPILKQMQNFEFYTLNQEFDFALA